MRILFVSNFYPPHHIGGYELACSEMAEALAARGHEIAVLTSTYGITRSQHHGNVYRWLQSDLGWRINSTPRYLLSLTRRELVNQRAFRLICRRFRPDVVYAWNLRSISLSLCVTAQRMTLPVCYYAFDNWLTELETDPWFSLIDHRPKRFYRRMFWPVGRTILRIAGLLPRSGVVNLSYVQFASNYLKGVALRAGKHIVRAKVIPWGVDLKHYRYKEGGAQGGQLLYVGQLVPHKGVHTAVEALSVLLRQRGMDSATLTIVGGSIFPPHEKELRQLIARLGLDRKVGFTGVIPRRELALLYANYDVLLFPSIWDEPFGITLLEAMAAGIPVVGTATGGAAEILDDGVNALVFHKGNAIDCATRIRRLLENRDLYERVRTGGRRTVEQRFRIDQTIDSIERDLAAIPMPQALN